MTIPESIVHANGNDRPYAEGQTSTPEIRQCEKRPELEYYLDLPRNSAENAPVLVAVHGISRNAKEQARAFAPVAGRSGYVVVAPQFNEEFFPSYQRLGIRNGRHLSEPAAALLDVLDEVSSHTGSDTRKICLFGFSGGGQFVHRFTMRHPERVRSIVVGAPGWTTFPDRSAPYPRGIGGMPELDPTAFLRIPALVLVGDRDTERDSALNKAGNVDSQQGRTRVERGRRWVRAMRKAAKLRGIDAFDFRFQTLTGCAHSFEECVMQGNLTEISMRFFNETGRNLHPTEADHNGSRKLVTRA